MKRMGFPAREGRSISFSGMFIFLPKHLLVRHAFKLPFPLVPPSSQAYMSLEACGKNENLDLESKGFPLHPPRPELLGL